MHSRQTPKQAIKEHVKHKNTSSTLDAKHTQIKNTLNKSNHFYCKSMFIQFREHILLHVSLVMTKSHCTYTIVSRVVKSMHVMCETFARRISVSLDEKCDDIRESNTSIHNHNCLMGTITFEVHHITPTSPRNTLATIYKSILILFAFSYSLHFFQHNEAYHAWHIGDKRNTHLFFLLCKCYTLPSTIFMNCTQMFMIDEF